MAGLSASNAFSILATVFLRHLLFDGLCMTRLKILTKVNLLERILTSARFLRAGASSTRTILAILPGCGVRFCGVASALGISCRLGLRAHLVDFFGEFS